MKKGREGEGGGDTRREKAKKGKGKKGKGNRGE